MLAVVVTAFRIPLSSLLSVPLSSTTYLKSQCVYFLTSSLSLTLARIEEEDVIFGGVHRQGKGGSVRAPPRKSHFQVIC